MNRLKNEGVTGGNNNNMMMGNSNNNMDEVVNVEDIEKLEKSIEELKTIDNACQQFMESKNLGKASRQKFLNIFKVLKQINGDVDVNANIRNQTEFKNAIHSIAASSTELVKQYDQRNALKNQTQSAKQNMLKVLKDAKLSKKSQEKFEKLLADPNFDKEMFSNFSNDVQQKDGKKKQLDILEKKDLEQQGKEVVKHLERWGTNVKRSNVHEGRKKT